MAFNPKSLQNLNRKGRQKKITTALKDVPIDAQQKIYAALWTALTHNNYADAKKYLESVNIPDYGFVIQLAIKELGSKNGWRCFIDIAERLFGKPQLMILSDKDTPTFKIEFVKNEEEDNDNDNEDDEG